MNQTEILKHHQVEQNKNSLNCHQNNSYSNQNSTVTVIKANYYENQRQKTPRNDGISKNGSSNKMIRVSSTKGINVISVRPTSSEKQVRQFSSNNNLSLAGSSQTTIKLDDQLCKAEMRKQLANAIQKYEDKMNQQLSYQHNYLTMEVDRLKEALNQNSNRLYKQQLQLHELLTRVESVQKKIEAKTNNMSKQIAEFKIFYQKCYNYTIKRVAQVQISMKSLCKSIDEQTSTHFNIECWKYIQYANSLIKNIVAKCSAQSSSLKYYVDRQIFDLQIQIGDFKQHYQEIQKIVTDMRIVHFASESFKDCVKQLGKFGIATNQLRKDTHKENILQYYEPKFKQIIKRVNSSTIQIDLVKSLIKCETQKQSEQNIQKNYKISELTNLISELEQKIKQQRMQFCKKIEQKQQILIKSNPRILELQCKLHAYLQQEQTMLKQMSDLKMKISYYQTKLNNNSQRQFGIQSTLAQAFSQTLIKQKARVFVDEKKKLQKKIHQLQLRITQLDNQNYLLAQKLSKQQGACHQNIKLQAELKFVSAILRQNQKREQENRKQIQALQVQITQYKIKQVGFKRDISELQKAALQQDKNYKILQQKLMTLQNQKNKAQEQDQLYLKQLQQQVEKNMKQIQKLEQKIKFIQFKNKQLARKNQDLQNDLQGYADTFEKQSITFRLALQNLQKQKDLISFESKKVSEQNRSLKLQLQHSKTTKSFYQNSSNLSLQLRKTVSTNLQFTPKSPMKKNQRKAFSSIQSTGNLNRLKNVLVKLKCQLPVVCEIDATGYLKDQRSGCYFADDHQNYFSLDNQQLQKAVSEGLILL